MKISPMSSAGTVLGSIEAGDTAASPVIQKIRSMKMNTNATPGRVEEVPAAEPPLTVSDDKIDEATPAAEETQPLSPQFAALAKQRRALQVKEREIADREKALEAQKTTMGSAIDTARLKSDPLGVLRDAGVTYADLTDAVLADQQGYNPKLTELESKFKILEESLDKKFTDRESEIEQNTLEQISKRVNHLSAQGDDFALIRATNNQQKVVDLMREAWIKHKDLIDEVEAMKLVEEDLIKEGLKIANIEKVRSQLAPAAPAPAPMQQQRQMKTLTNRDTASVPLSRKARAIAAWNAVGALKK